MLTHAEIMAAPDDQVIGDYPYKSCWKSCVIEEETTCCIRCGCDLRTGQRTNRPFTAKDYKALWSIIDRQFLIEARKFASSPS